MKKILIIVLFLQTFTLLACSSASKDVNDTDDTSTLEVTDTSTDTNADTNGNTSTDTSADTSADTSTDTNANTDSCTNDELMCHNNAVYKCVNNEFTIWSDCTTFKKICSTYNGFTDCYTADSDSDSSTDTNSDSDSDTSSDSGSITACTNILSMTTRDFTHTHPDFFDAGSIACWTATQGLVQDTLDSEGKPVFKSATGTLLDSTKNCVDINMLSNADNFSQWYRTTSEVNVAYSMQLQLSDKKEAGNFIYENTSFFPIDGVASDDGASDDGEASHNYLFTTEIHTRFQYEKGQEFYFYGDDDIWIFVNGKLALDLGGIHTQQEGTIYMDNLGLTEGQIYKLDIFQADRQPTYSNFKINTSINCFIPSIF